MIDHILTEVFLSDFETQLNPIIGKAPLFLSLLDNDQMETFSILEQISCSLAKSNVHPVIPYPIYILSEFNNVHPSFVTHKCLEDIPDYFLQNKEKGEENKIQTLNNIKNITYKLNNLNIESKLSMIKTKLKRTKKLHHLTNEFLTLKMIHQKITRNHNE